MKSEPLKPADLSIDHPSAETILIRLSGAWRNDNQIPTMEDVDRQLPAGGIARIGFDSSAMTGWDSGFLVFLIELKQRFSGSQIEIDPSGLPDGVSSILAIASAVPEKTDTGGESPHDSFLVRVGKDTMAFFQIVMNASFLSSTLTITSTLILRGCNAIFNSYSIGFKLLFDQYP